MAETHATDGAMGELHRLAGAAAAHELLGRQHAQPVVVGRRAEERRRHRGGELVRHRHRREARDQGHGHAGGERGQRAEGQHRHRVGVRAGEQPRRGAEERAGARRQGELCLLYTSPSPRDRTRSRMPSSA